MTQSHETAARNAALGEQLASIIEQLPEDSLTLGELLDVFGDEGLLLLTILLTIVFLIPVSIPGVSTVFGGAILLIGVSRLVGRPLWLPRKLREKALPAAKLRPALLLMAPFGFVPFSNTLPGVALLFYGIGLIQRDGVAIVLGHAANILTIIYFGILIGGGGLAVREVLQRLTGG